MARQIINSIECGFCHSFFDVATEDIEWEHLKDHGECDDNSALHDFAVWQNVCCPHCGKDNNILYKTIGKSADNIQNGEVISMEIGTLCK